MAESGKLILVTGANGFVGSHLAEALLERGYRVRCMVRRTSDLTYVHHLPVEWSYVDLRDALGLREACQDVTAVCHAAALTRALDEETFQRVNAEGTRALAQACVEASPKLERFLFVSSQTAAGPSRDGEDWVDESDPTRPITWYGKSKLAAEQALWAMTDHLPVTIVRPAAVYGPRDRDFYTYFELVNRGLSLKLGREERRISLIYVHDLVRLILSALESEQARGQIYIGCSGTSNYTELSQEIARALGKKPWTITLPEMVLTPMALWSKVQGRLTGKPALLNDQRIIDMRERYWLCSGEKARRELGFEPQYDMERGVKETADWYLKNGWL